MLKRVLFLCILSTILLLLGQQVETQECDQTPSQPFPIFSRILHVMWSGPLPPPATKESLTAALGSCGKIEDLAEQMFKYYEPLGVNLERTRSNPYGVFEDANFILAPQNVDPKSNYRIVSETFFDYPTYRDTFLTYVGWVFTAKTHINGPGRRLSQNEVSVFGIFRFKAHGRDFCISYKEREPVVIFTKTSTTPMDLILHNEYWGYGSARGLFITRQKDNITHIDLRYMMTFPADL